MKRLTKLWSPKVTQQESRHDAHDRLINASMSDTSILLTELKSSHEGLSTAQVYKSRDAFGENNIEGASQQGLIRRLFDAFINPFTSILIALAVVSLITDVLTAVGEDKDWTTVVIITTMVFISGLLRFVQESRSNKAADRLSEMVQTTTCVARRRDGRQERPIDDVVVGDIIYLSAGDLIPADCRVIESKDLFIAQSALTGESEHVEKRSQAVIESYGSITETPNLVFMGSDVISGSAKCIVIAVGSETLFGSISESILDTPEQTSFEKGVNDVSWLLIRFMMVMVPIVFVINGVSKNDWMGAFLFAISIAVGLTPEMLPMIVTTTLAKGAVNMSKQKTIVKDLNAIQNLGSMDILCTDKTGTLTQDKVVLEYHLNTRGEEDIRVLRHAFLNSYYQTGLKNLMDKSIIERTHTLSAEYDALIGLDMHYIKIDEVPFDFVRRRMSVVVVDRKNKKQMITKGAVEEMLDVCSYVEENGESIALDETRRQEILNRVESLNKQGLRVLAIAQKTNPAPVGEFSVKDESDMILMGYLAFLDPPKESAKSALAALTQYGVRTKVLTGDNDHVTRAVCNRIGIDSSRIYLGSEIEKMSDIRLREAVVEGDIFAKLSPTQKSRIVVALRDNGYTVGFLGDGINDAPAMKAADIGISVDTGVDIAKECAEVILLEKDLHILETGIIEGRKTYANMIKYIKMTASSNFGNVFSVLIASAFLPFLPMAAIHLILLNLIYDLSCVAIPWDNVDEDYLMVPRKWDATSIRNFMLIIGPTSSIFDITTYALMYWVIGPAVLGGQFHTLDLASQTYFIALFQAGWFVESMWSQTLVIHMIRSEKIPFIQSRASKSLTILTFTGILLLTVIPFTSVGLSLGLAPLPPVFFMWLALTILLYMVTVTFAKRFFIKKYGELL